MKFLLLPLLGLSFHLAAAPLIVGGASIQDSVYPEVIHFETMDENGSMSLCTGTYLSTNIIITAAHCVYKKERDLVLDENHIIQEVFISDPWIYLKEDDRQGNDILRIPFDVALILLKNESKTRVGMPYSKVPQLGAAEIIGFGGAQVRTVYQNNRSVDPTIGQKRLGRTYLSKIYPIGKIASETTFYTPKKNSWAQSSRGDSGGPLIQGGKVIGVISSSDALSQTNETVHSLTSYFAGLHSENFAELVTRAKKKGGKFR